jgi:hypothetical protein
VLGPECAQRLRHSAYGGCDDSARSLANAMECAETLGLASHSRRAATGELHMPAMSAIMSVLTCAAQVSMQALLSTLAIQSTIGHRRQYRALTRRNTLKNARRTLRFCSCTTYLAPVISVARSCVRW